MHAIVPILWFSTPTTEVLINSKWIACHKRKCLCMRDRSEFRAQFLLHGDEHERPESSNRHAMSSYCVARCVRHSFESAVFTCEQRTNFTQKAFTEDRNSIWFIWLLAWINIFVDKSNSYVRVNHFTDSTGRVLEILFRPFQNNFEINSKIEYSVRLELGRTPCNEALEKKNNFILHWDCRHNPREKIPIDFDGESAKVLLFIENCR